MVKKSRWRMNRRLRSKWIFSERLLALLAYERNDFLLILAMFRLSLNYCRKKVVVRVAEVTERDVDHVLTHVGDCVSGFKARPLGSKYDQYFVHRIEMLEHTNG